MNCEFEEVGDFYKCKNCGFQIPKMYTKNIIHRTCDKGKEAIPSPSLVEMAKNFTGAMIDYAKSGFKNVDDKEQERRLGICGGCEFFKQGTCIQCGCGMALKTRLSTSSCPIGKW